MKFQAIYDKLDNDTSFAFESKNSPDTGYISDCYAQEIWNKVSLAEGDLSWVLDYLVVSMYVETHAGILVIIIDYEKGVQED